MRNIKFRAWHPELKKMLYPPFGFDSMLHVRDSDGKHVIIELPNSNKVPFQASMIWDGRMYIQGYSQHVEFLQYTGHNDKNGVEIYEGDLLKFFDKVIAEVVFEPFGGWCYKWIDATYIRVRSKNPEPFFHNINMWEVVGNIYMNPSTLSPTTEVVER